MEDPAAAEARDEQPLPQVARVRGGEEAAFKPAFYAPGPQPPLPKRWGQSEAPRHAPLPRDTSLSAANTVALIPGLPDELAQLCIAHVRRTPAYFAELKQVSRRWREVLNGRQVYALRRRLHLAEELLLMMTRQQVKHVAEAESSRISGRTGSGGNSRRAAGDQPSDGATGRRVQNRWAVLDRRAKVWRTLPPMPLVHRGATGTCAAVIDKRLYVAGGIDVDGTVLPLLSCYDWRSNSWRGLKAMSCPRRWAGMVALNGLLFILGGEEGTDAAALPLLPPPPDCYSPPLGAPMHPAAAEAAERGPPPGACIGEVYDPLRDTWQPLTARLRGGLEGAALATCHVRDCAVVGDSICAVSPAQGFSYDPASGDAWPVPWSLRCGWQGKATAAGSRLLAIDQVSRCLTRYDLGAEDWAAAEWVRLGPLRSRKRLAWNAVPVSQQLCGKVCIVGPGSFDSAVAVLEVGSAELAGPPAAGEMHATSFTTQLDGSSRDIVHCVTLEL